MMNHQKRLFSPVYRYILLISLAAGTIIAILMDKTDQTAGAFLAAGFILVALLGLNALWNWAGKEKTLAWIIAVAFLLRLGTGVALMVTLPVAGYDTDQQRAGYVFYDAYRRDTQAQQLAGSDKPILTAFTKKYATDQYGGYLALSMLVYRYLSGGFPRPQLMLILGAFAGAAAIPFFWKLLTRLCASALRKSTALAGRSSVSEGSLPGKGVTLGCWLLCLYPESILLGASQMREPYLILLITISLWAAGEMLQDQTRKLIWVWILCTLGLLLISPGMLFPLALFIFGWWWIDRRGKKLPAWAIAVLVVVLLAAVLVFAVSVSHNNNVLDRNSPFRVILNWFSNAMAWDISGTTDASGRLEYIFEDLPAWLHTPFVVIYGLLQPVLPAALLDPARFIWNLISSLLGGGWYLVLPVFIYATFAVFKSDSSTEKRLLLWLVLINWSWLLVSSARAGGDQWDNPRYRTILLPLLAWVVAWAWEHARQHHFYWMNHIWGMEAVFLAFFTQWYASRYYQVIGRLPFTRMVILILALWVVILLGGVVRQRWSYRR